MKFLLKIIRILNKLMMSDQNERIFTERIFKDKKVYEFRKL